MSSEIQSLENINYGLKIKKYLFLTSLPFLFIFAFLTHYPISEKVNDLIQSNLRATGCPATFTNLKFEFLLPKIIISDLNLPRRCTGGTEDLFFKTVTLNYHLISFAPFGLPFRVDTRLYGQDIALHYVLGIGKQSVRLKDQKLDLSKLSPLLPQVKLRGAVTVDMRTILEGNAINELTLKASSSNFEVPAQNIQGFSLPTLAIKDVFIDAQTKESNRLDIEKLIIGGTNENSPIRANITGSINLSQRNMLSSALNLSSEVSFSKDLKEAIPLLEMMLENYEIKDGFYQIKIGGTVGAPSFK
ncbi:MAG: type II secretion system protein GspN [Candidatus Caldatribacteriota bacterium]